jgi:rhamnose transport system permease protein
MRRHRLQTSEWVLVAALVAEVVVFTVVAPNFFTLANGLEVTRVSVELGLLALALTPILVAGGIDLSVGSLMGLAAVAFGAAHQVWHAPIPVAMLTALAVGIAGGALNAFLVAWLQVPPLIVTLGTFALFRGIAEGVTQAAVNYSGFPAGFLALGQGYLGGIVPAQVPLFAIVALAYAALLHRSVIGRALYAIGFSAPGARYAGIPVKQRVAPIYLLSGVMASVAAIVYAAHLGQARADAGTGYELDAIAAVVLGGTSVFGGRGTIGGTLLGLFVLAVLKNGLYLSALSSELVGVLTGRFSFQRSRSIGSPTASSRASHARRRRGYPCETVRWLCCAQRFFVGSFLVAGTNVWLVRSITSNAGDAPRANASGSRPVVAMMPKAKGDPYFVSCRVGAEEAAKELGVDLIWDGPTSLDAARQNELVESWITRGVDAIAVAVENRAGISTVLRKARSRGIPVVTWDADAEPDARDAFVNQATAEDIGNTLTDEAARLLGGRGEFAIITGALTAANQNEWIAFIRKRLSDRHPGLTLATIRPSDDDRDKAFAETQTILRVYPSISLVMAISAPAVPGAAEAVRQAGRGGEVRVIGLSLPNINKPYVHDGTVQTVVLWNTADLGYLAVKVAASLAADRLTRPASSFDSGRLGVVRIRGTEVLLGPPLLFTKSNIDRFDF